MAIEPSEQLKIVTTQASNIPQPQPLDPNVESMLQSLLIEDPSLMRILKGEIQETLNKVEESNLRLNQFFQALLDRFKPLPPEILMGQVVELNRLLKVLGEAVQKVHREARWYKHIVPYLLLFTSSSVLSNITEKEANGIWRKIDIMITRDRLDCMDDESLLGDLNLFDSIGIKAFLHIRRNVSGYTFKGLIEEKRTVQNIITDTTLQPKKRRFGLF